MKTWIKYLAAKWLMNRMMRTVIPNEIDKKTADKWNHLQGLLITKGNIKWRWDKIL